jgi:hypothetical protein
VRVCSFFEREGVLHFERAGVCVSSQLCSATLFALLGQMCMFVPQLCSLFERADVLHFDGNFGASR